MKRRLTVTMDDELLRKVKILAALKKRSVSNMVALYLEYGIEHEVQMTSTKDYHDKQ